VSLICRASSPSGTPNPSIARRKPSGPPPTLPTLWKAFDHVFTELVWTVEVVSPDPLAVVLTGDDRFRHFLSGSADSKFPARARTAVVQAAAGIAARLSDRSLRLLIGLPADGHLDAAREARLTEVARAKVKRRVRDIIEAGGYEALLDASIVAADDAASPGPGDVSPAPAIESSKPAPDDFVGILTLIATTPPPPHWVLSLGREMSADDAARLVDWLDCSDKAVKAAVNYIFSNGMSWLIVIPNDDVSGVTAIGDYRFEDPARNKALNTERGRAHALVVRTLLTRLAQLDRSAFLSMAGVGASVDVDDPAQRTAIMAVFKTRLHAEFLAAVMVGGKQGMVDLVHRAGLLRPTGSPALEEVE
jgi:hypothetical protein